MVYHREQVAQRAEEAARERRRYTPGMCQSITRGLVGVHAVGDVDGDGDADAVDGWKSEPLSARHNYDRQAPRGTVLAWGGGRNGFGHRAISLGNGKIGTSDGGGPGIYAVVDFGWVERNWGMRYLGWSETMSGVPIPLPPKPEPPKTSRGKLVDAAIRKLEKVVAKPGSERAEKVAKALRKLKSLPFIK